MRTRKFACRLRIAIDIRRGSRKIAETILRKETALSRFRLSVSLCCAGNECKKNSAVRVTEQSLIAREYAEGLPRKSNEVDFVQGKRHYLVSRFLHGLIRNSQVRVSIAYSNRHTPRFPQNCRNNFAKGYGVISFYIFCGRQFA